MTPPGAISPISTYRLQFGPTFHLPDALDLVPYLASLGVSHVYASPLLKARPGSEHGYDITDHNAINPEIGTWDDFVRFTDALRARGMGLVLDFVPNHMGIGKDDNAWWLDVLEAGQGSIYADFFDIDWAPQRRELRGKVLLPFLGAHYGAALTGGELVLRFDGASGTLSAWYHEHRLPLRARSYAAVIRRQLARGNDARLTDAVRASLKDLADAFDRVRRASRRRREEAYRHANKLKAELAALCREHGAAAPFMDAAAAAFNGTAGDAESFRPMHALLERQFYRLAYWRVAADEINYRRFFNINELAGVRMENRTLFEKAHALVGRMIAEGRLDGLRLDHVDGLFDPEAYVRHLQSFATAQRREPERRSPFYIVVEKILAHHEALRPTWPIAGTTGYEFANLLNGLFVDPAGAEGCARAYHEFVGAVRPFDEVVLAAKDIVIDSILASELGVLADELDRISERHWSTRDFARRRLREALKAVVRQFPVYRTYVSGRGVSPEDRRDLDWAVGRAKRAWHGADREILDFVHEALTGDLARRGRPFRRADVLRFAMHFQQYTGPVMAKSFEDTAFYRHHRLIALNEVGGDPRQFGVSASAFHHANRERARHWPYSMLATSTHDTKRGEDARLRIDVLSEVPDEWGRRAARWSELNRALRREVDGAPAPSRNDEYLLYQALLGAWPAAFLVEASDAGKLARFAERMQRFLLKAMREAKLESSWENPNQAYEDASLAFTRELLERAPNPFLIDFSDFAARVARFAMLSSISQTVLRLTAPGVPDTYQGAETWDHSLVDPDNRAPVDFAGLRRIADSAMNRESTQLMAHWADGGLKLRLTATLLKLRRELADVFLGGSYEPLRAEGARADHVVAFARASRERGVAVIAGRLFVRLLGWDAERYDRTVWRETTITWPEELRGSWRDAIGGTCVVIDRGQAAVEELLARLPAAVLVRDRG